MTVKGLSSAFDIPKIPGNGPTENTINTLIERQNFMSKNLSFQSNFNGQVLDVTFKAGEVKNITHSLGIVPRYRIILRQEGNGVISDIPSDWTKNSIKLVNNGSVPVTATILIVRE